MEGIKPLRFKELFFKPYFNTRTEHLLLLFYSKKHLNNYNIKVYITTVNARQAK
jgi:hypothetical protein